MKLKFTLTALFALCGLFAFADVTGETPTTGSAYYLYNVGQQKYLTVNASGAVELGSAGTQFTVATGTNSGTYTLTASAKLTTTYPYGVACTDDGYYTDWKFSLLSSTDKTYALGVLEDEDAYSFSYIFYSTALAAVANAPVMPSFADGQWIFTTGSTPAVTYTVTVEPLEDMAYDATTATVKYTVSASTGETYDCTKVVTFAANDTYEVVTRSGEFTDETYNVKVPWSVKLGAKPITYSLGSVDVPTVEYDITSATITYTIHPSYGNDINCSHDVTFEANDTNEEVTRTGEFTDETYHVLVPWSVKVAAKPEEGKFTEVTLYQASETYSIPENMASTVTVYFDRTIMLCNKRNTFCVPFDMTYAQAASIFGNNVSIYEYTRNSGGRIYYKLTGSIKAGNPYIIVPTITYDGDYYVVEDVDASSFVAEPTPVTKGSFTFYGTFVKSTPAPTDIYTYNNGTFYHYSAAASISAFRAYFKANTAGAKITDECVEDETDGISEITEMPSEEFDVYTINGQMVKSNTTSLSGLARGVYIVDGKKVVIK